MNYTNYLNDNNPRVVLKMTTNEEMVIELFPNIAPITCDNFLSLVDKGFYDGLIFHRVIKGFMIQGGDPEGTGMGGSKNHIKGEFAINGVPNPLMHTKGVISMARAYDPNSASSQFFIMHEDSPHLDGSYAAFGVVVEGIEVVDKIASTKTNIEDRPLQVQRIESIKRV